MPKKIGSVACQKNGHLGKDADTDTSNWIHPCQMAISGQLGKDGWHYENMNISLGIRTQMFFISRHSEQPSLTSLFCQPE